MGSLQNKSVSTAVGVALRAAALGGALAAGARCIQLVRTRAGRARVKVLKLEDGSEVRVLARGGVFQSATYLGERWSEPVFEYIRAFDTMFEALPQMRAWYAHGIGRVLMLGGGGFSYPKALLAARDGGSILTVWSKRWVRAWAFVPRTRARISSASLWRALSLCFMTL